MGFREKVKDKRNQNQGSEDLKQANLVATDQKLTSGLQDIGSSAPQGSILQSSASFAGSGASLGSLIAPGVGTAVGAGIGAGVGLAAGIAKSRAARKRRKAEAEQKALLAISNIHKNSGAERLNALQNIGNSIANAFKI